ncbi:hypothetical protein PtB15_6B79 [Puccinia triticina]|nr:hypothetical protein PtB15_6B79 [Puccinia triticina]
MTFLHGPVGSTLLHRPRLFVPAGTNPPAGCTFLHGPFGSTLLHRPVDCTFLPSATGYDGERCAARDPGRPRLRHQLHTCSPVWCRL